MALVEAASVRSRRKRDDADGEKGESDSDEESEEGEDGEDGAGSQEEAGDGQGGGRAGVVRRRAAAAMTQGEELASGRFQDPNFFVPNMPGSILQEEEAYAVGRSAAPTNLRLATSCCELNHGSIRPSSFCGGSCPVASLPSKRRISISATSKANQSEEGSPPCRTRCLRDVVEAASFPRIRRNVALGVSVRGPIPEHWLHVPFLRRRFVVETQCTFTFPRTISLCR